MTRPTPTFDLVTPARRAAAAARKRRSRDRAQRGRMAGMVEFDELLTDQLIAEGFLRPEHADDRAHVLAAVGAYLDASVTRDTVCGE